MKKDLINPMPEYFNRYINKTDDVTLLQALELSLQELDNLPMAKYLALGDKVYAEGKWTIKDIFQHMIDTERVFTYRALAFARNEADKVQSYDEEIYAKHADANRRSLEDIISELKLVRHSFIELYKSFTPEMIMRSGKGFKGEYSVLSIGFMMPGHQRWHMDVITERYFPLIEK
ncbi:MAG: DinB family protein [Bacteroidia bacterium]|nr:DinB family protein [Bacteroidia bacterium]